MPACCTLRLNCFSATSNELPGLTMIWLMQLPARSTAICITVIIFAWLVAILAIDRAIFSRLEGYASFVATACASGSVHGACFALAEPAAATTLSTAGTSLVATGLFTGGAALGATARCIGQATAGIKFLLTDSKGELLVAISTIQGLVSQ